MITGPCTTVNNTPLLAIPPTVTTTFPVVAPVGAVVTMLVVLQLVGVASTPLNATVLAPCVDPKFTPLIVTDVPTGPAVGERPLIPGPELTVKFTPLLATPLTVTTTFPVVAPVGTGATMRALLQLVGVAAVPLNVTVLVPGVDPKFTPVIVTEVSTDPEVGFKLKTAGPAPGSKITQLLDSPATVTTTQPTVAPLGTGTTMPVALQPVGVASAPLKVTVLCPCVDPKFVPVIVIEVPADPD